MPNNCLRLAALAALAAGSLCTNVALAKQDSQQYPQWHIADKATLDATIDGYVTSGKLPLLYVRIEDKAGNLVYEHGKRNKQLTPDILPKYSNGSDDWSNAWFRIWSMSKIVTIAAALDMIEDGVLYFDDPVSKYIPEFANLRVATTPQGESLARLAQAAAMGDHTKANALKTLPCPLQTTTTRNPMTIRDLLNHKGGFYYQTGVACLDKRLAVQKLALAENSQQLIDRLATMPLIQQPGDSYFYGLNTTVLGLVMERASRQSLQSIVRERITKPLDIDNLRYGLPQGARLYPSYGGADGTLKQVPAEQLDIFVAPPQGNDIDSQLFLGGEGMVATTAAYADFLHMLLGRGKANGQHILDEETIELLTSPHTQLDSDWGYNGLNLWVNSGKLGDGNYGVGGLWIGGGYEGTYFWVDSKRGLLGLIMTQVNRAPAGGDAKNDAIREAVYRALGVHASPPL